MRPPPDGYVQEDSVRTSVGAARRASARRAGARDRGAPLLASLAFDHLAVRACPLHEARDMSKRKTWSWLTVLLSAMLAAMLSYASCQRDSEAQVVADSLGPIDCFQVADEIGIASTSAVELCAGATSVAPGQCLAAAVDRGVLTIQQIVELCQGSTSLESFSCFDELAAMGTLTNQQMIEYCGMRCPLGPPPPEAGNPQCLAAALDNADLTAQSGAELCLLATSASPVDCFVAGEAGTRLPDSQLIQLCAERTHCQYINAPATVAY